MVIQFYTILQPFYFVSQLHLNVQNKWAIRVHDEHQQIDTDVGTVAQWQSIYQEVRSEIDGSQLHLWNRADITHRHAWV